FAVAIVASILIWKWIHHQPKIADAPKPLRKVLSLDEKVFSKTLSNTHLAKTYPVSEAVKHVRVNGDIGMKSALDSNWKLHLVESICDILLRPLPNFKLLPYTELFIPAF